jgi:PGF-CTERM protein
MRLKALAAALLLVVASVGTAAGAVATADASEQSGQAYAETHVSFETRDNAVVNYTVDGQTVVEGLSVQSHSEAESGTGVGAGADLSARTEFEGASLSVASSATTSTRATVEAESGARMTAHDNERGILVVGAGGEPQYVRANVSSEAEARQESESRVVVHREDGTSGAFLVVGDGNVTVSEEGAVTASLSEDARLVYRQYDEERSDDERRQEELIANGTAVAEVYLTAEESSDAGQAAATSVVNYTADTTVEMGERTQHRANVTVERAQSEGKVVIASISNKTFESAEDVEVYVDGQAAAEASSYSEVQSATAGGDRSAFLVTSSANADAAADVVIGINHFSAREVSIQSGADDTPTETHADTETVTESGGSGDGGSGDATETDGQPGFGALAALAALGAALLAARTRS